MPTKKMVGEPDAGNLQVRFDEGEQETCFGNAPVLYSTNSPHGVKIFFETLTC